MLNKNAIFPIYLLAIWSCSRPDQVVEQRQSAPLFQELDPSLSGVKHLNTIIETDLINFYTWKYIYNGSGVAVGDINNDGLTDIYLGSNMYAAKLYLNEGDLKFRNITKESGVLANGGYKTGVSMADLNGDGWLDIYVCRDALENRDLRTNLVYINNGDLTFTERGEELGLTDKAYSTQAYFLDYDLDNDLDIFLVNHPNNFDQAIRARLKPGTREREVKPENPFFSDRLFRNDDGLFTDVSLQSGLANHAFGLSASISDVNQDGFPDIFIANDFVEPDQLMINNGDGTFSDRIDDYMKHMSKSSMGSDFGDINNDGLEDLVVMDMLPDQIERQKTQSTPMGYERHQIFLNFGYGQQIMRNMLHLNRGASFSEIGQLAGIDQTDWSWGALLIDLDNDGLKDMVVGNGIKKDMTNLDYLNFTIDSVRKARIEKKEAINLDNWREWVDFIPSNRIRNYAFRNTGELQFEDKSSEWGLTRKTFSNGVASADLDNDGDLDLIFNNLEDTVLIYENQSQSKYDYHFLKVRLIGPPGNQFGVGARVWCYSAAGVQNTYQYPVRGFLSSIEPIVHFGLGGVRTVDSIVVEWPDRRRTKIPEPLADRLTEVVYQDASLPVPAQAVPPEPLMTPVHFYGDMVHRENAFEDFRREPLLPHAFSMQGPALAVADLSNNGLDEIVMTGASGTPTSYFHHTSEGLKQAFFTNGEIDASCEDVDVVVADFDSDGNADVYVMSGGNDTRDLGYKDRLYLNEESGWSRKVLDELPGPGGAVVTLDLDADGDLDIFRGGGVVPGDYPLAVPSIVFENIAGELRLHAEWTSNVKGIGMVTDALAVDLNGDNSEELVVVGEWMPISIWQVDKDGLTEITDQLGLKEYTGWWRSVNAADINGDGFMDLIAGNIGLNSRYKASPDQPLEAYIDDFDQNGDIESILTFYDDGIRQPVARKEVLASVLKMINKKYVKYEDYAKAGIFDLVDVSKAQYRRANYTASMLFYGGASGFTSHMLPMECQFAPLEDALIMDLDNDDDLDILTVGNFYGAEVEQGPYDAGRGVVLIQEKNGWIVMDSASGFNASMDARSLVRLVMHDRRIVLVGNNNHQVQAFGL